MPDAGRLDTSTAAPSGRSADRQDGGRRARAVFRPIVGSRAALEVADQLSFAVMSGLYQPGEFLPTVEELAEVMRVSRPTIGEAVRLLASGGVLEVRRGAKGGISVLNAAVPPSLLKLSRLRRGRTLTEVLEARRPVALALVRLAAERGTEQDFERLQSANDLLAQSEDDTREWTQANNLFHATIGHAASNELLTYIEHEIQEELELLLDGYNKRYSDPQRTIREHEAILEHLRAGDADAAAAAMSTHLRALEEIAPARDAELTATRAIDAIAPPPRRQHAALKR